MYLLIVQQSLIREIAVSKFIALPLEYAVYNNITKYRKEDMKNMEERIDCKKIWKRIWKVWERI